MKHIKNLHGIMLFSAALMLITLFVIVGMVTLNIAKMSKGYLDTELAKQVVAKRNNIIKSQIRTQLSNTTQEKIFFVDKNTDTDNSFGFKCVFKAATAGGNASCSSSAADIPFNDPSIINNFSDLKTQQYNYTVPATNTTTAITVPITITIKQTNYNTSNISAIYDLYLTASGVNNNDLSTTNLKVTKACPALLSIAANAIPTNRIKNLATLARKPQMIPLTATQLTSLNSYNTITLPIEYPNLYCTCSIGKTLADGTCLICSNNNYLKGEVCASCPVNATCSYNEVTCNSGFTKSYDENNEVICKHICKPGYAPDSRPSSCGVFCAAGTYYTGLDNADYCLKNTVIPNCSIYSKETNTCKTCNNNSNNTYYLKDGSLTTLNLIPSNQNLLQSNNIYFSKNANNKLLYTVVDGSTPKKQVTAKTEIDTTTEAALTTSFLASNKSKILNNINIKNHIPNQCIICPSNATCSTNTVTCNPGFTKVLDSSGVITACNCPGSSPANSTFYSVKPASIGGKAVAAVGSGGCYCGVNKYWDLNAAPAPGCTDCPGTSQYYVNPPSGIGEVAVNNCYCANNQYWKIGATLGASACAGCPGSSQYYTKANLPSNIGGASVANKCYCPTNKYWNTTVTPQACNDCPGASKYYVNPPSNIGGVAVDNCYCPANTYWDASVTPAACTGCIGGSQYYSQANLPSNIGGASVENTCYCKANYYWDPIKIKCTPCTSNSTNNSCTTQCPSYSDYSKTTLAGRFRITNSNCYCKLNYYWDSINNACAQCPSGSTYSSSVALDKSPIFNTNCYCDTGYWTGSSPKIGYCKSCAEITPNSDFHLQPTAGGVKVPNSNCYCRTGYYLSSSGKCLLNTAIHCYQQSLIANECANCNAGYKLDNNNKTCTACPAGYISHNNGATDCTQCTAGTAANALIGATGCIDCTTPGTYSGAGATSCSTCVAGTYANAATKATGCIACFSGAATRCPAGSTAKNSCFSGAVPEGNDCKCNAGKYLNNGSCMDCPAGTYRSTSGATSISDCLDCYTGIITGGTCPAGSIAKNSCMSDPSPVNNNCGCNISAGYHLVNGQCYPCRVYNNSVYDQVNYGSSYNAYGAFSCTRLIFRGSNTAYWPWQPNYGEYYSPWLETDSGNISCCSRDMMGGRLITFIYKSSANEPEVVVTH